MPLEPISPSSLPDALNELYPDGTDEMSFGDNHLRGVKIVVRNARAAQQAFFASSYARLQAVQAIIDGVAVDADKLGGQESLYYLTGDNKTAGILASARLSGTYDIGISGNAATATLANLAQIADSAADTIRLQGNDPPVLTYMPDGMTAGLFTAVTATIDQAYTHGANPLYRVIFAWDFTVTASAKERFAIVMLRKPMPIYVWGDTGLLFRTGTPFPEWNPSSGTRLIQLDEIQKDAELYICATVCIPPGATKLYFRDRFSIHQGYWSPWSVTTARLGFIT